MIEAVLDNSVEERNEFKLAGWLMLLTVMLAVPESIFGILTDMKPRASVVFFPLNASVALFDIAISVYAVLKFRKFLNVRFNFHAVDTLIIVILISHIILVFTSLGARALVFFDALGLAYFSDNDKIPFIIAMICILVPLSVLGIIYGVRLLNIPSNLNGYLKPMAYTQIIGSSMCASVILAPLGIFVVLASTAITGLVLINSDKLEETADFV